MDAALLFWVGHFFNLVPVIQGQRYINYDTYDDEESNSGGHYSFTLSVESELSGLFLHRFENDG